ncbi:MAG: transporter substrate-binding protein [Bacilli bacterium]|jgi:putative aldouronate transport system substrate-binding protein|nr:transporter substrate-binding protein [Bacilli bacterium]
MTFRKSLTLLVVVLLSFSLLLSACSTKVATTNVSPDATKATVESANPATPAANLANASDLQSKVKPVSFSWYANYDWFTPEKYGDQPDSKWVIDNLKVNLNPISSGGAAATKLNSMIVGNELPDVLVLDRGKDVERLQQAGKLVALDPYLAKYPEFVKLIGEKTLNLLRSPDGKLYQIPNWYINGPNGNGNAAYIVEKKIYKALGSPKLETWDDLESYLKLVKSKYTDVVPFDAGEIRDGAELQALGMFYSGSTTNVSAGFVAPTSGNAFGVPKDNKLTSVYTDPDFQATALFTSKLYREGLISKDILTENRDQIKEKLTKGKIAVWAAYDAVVEGLGREANNQLKAIDPEDGYMAIWPIHKEGVDKNKVYPSGYNTLGWNVNVISTNAKDPEAIFTYMTWATSPEGQRILFFGPQGLFYDKVEDGVPIPNDAYIKRDQKKYDDMKIGFFNFSGNTAYIDGTKAKREKLLPAEAQDWTTLAQANIAFKTSMNVTEFSNLDPVPNSEEGIIMQRLKDQYKQTTAKIIFAKSDDEVKALLTQADQEAKKLGYDKVLQYKTNVWQANLKKMGN